MGDLHGPRIGNLGLHLWPGVRTGLRSEEIVFPAAVNVGQRVHMYKPPPPPPQSQGGLGVQGRPHLAAGLQQRTQQFSESTTHGPTKSDSLARLAANLHTESRQSLRVWGLFWRAKIFSSLHDFVYHALWKKLRVAERLSSWT